MTWTVPARIETERLVLRRLGPEDVTAMHEAILENVGHLLPFIPWAPAEPQTREQREAKVAEMSAAFDAGEDFALGMFDRATGEYVGGTGLHTRVGPEALEIGYWIRADRQGEGLVSEAVLALTAVALMYSGAAHVELWCDPANVRSNAVAARCGFDHRGREDRGEEGFEVWVADLGTLSREPASTTRLPRLADEAGTTLPWPVWQVPARIETERLVIRRFRHEDAPEVSRVIAANRDHLVRHLSWARDEPRTPEARAEKIALNIVNHEAGVEFLMGMFDRTGAYIGSIGLHPLDDRPGLEIGYWIAEVHEGRGLVTEAVTALTQVGLAFAGAETVEIFHRPGNTRSGAVPRRLGFVDHGITRDTDDGEEAVRWVADASVLDHEPLASAPVPRLADEDGTEVPWPA
ncbi:GNAT family N-acetyltransferase [Demequina sp. SYSU T00192]|uniref:GNAT family N-acetyltransferase n=1 Tax=Demequina litoralis TaxID=3051660 RepID=A0ABT8GAH1_9MICO|nr:GNAT family N-acetyltransferase [Demequina sp. SYSU T00192]MDN4476143.1 GNAT family N-acetyltransferase [Demequina sp. SYSU T00192]